MTTIISKDEFQRARTEEQRIQRRETILNITREMLQGRRLADLSFNEIAKQVGLAKSNIMRYFESREAILLTLLQNEYADWVKEVAAALPASEEADPVERVASVLAQTIMARPLLCELLTHVTTVLEHNVTTEEIIHFKLAVQSSMARIASLLVPYLGQLTPAQTGLFLRELHATVTHTWSLANPSAALQTAYQCSPEIGRMTSSAEEVVRETLATLLIGLRHRRPAGE